jgi:hypothetical protein
MKKAAVFLCGIFLSVSCLADTPRPALAKGKIVSVAPGKVVVQLEKGRGADFPVGTLDVELWAGDVLAAKGEISACDGDRIAFKDAENASVKLAPGDAVEVQLPESWAALNGC